MRNAAVRKLAVPDLTTTVLTLTITGLAADSSLARGTNPRLQRRIAAVVAMFAGAALGSITLRHSLFMALAFSVVLSSLCSLALLISSRLPGATDAEKG
jgi:cytochrome b subunit of formate dehydrogenase